MEAFLVLLRVSETFLYSFLYCPGEYREGHNMLCAFLLVKLYTFRYWVFICPLFSPSPVFYVYILLVDYIENRYFNRDALDNYIEVFAMCGDKKRCYSCDDEVKVLFALTSNCKACHVCGVNIIKRQYTNTG